MISEKDFRNRHLLRDNDSRANLRRVVKICRDFAENLPPGEDAQARELEKIVSAIGESIRKGVLVLGDVFGETAKINRLYKAPVGPGRVKLQLFSLTTNESHPPHAHGNLISCQVVLEGRVRMREFSLVRRLSDNRLEIEEHPTKILEQGQGVFTLQHRNNIHWQEGLSEENVLLNINWQGFLHASPLANRKAIHGRCYIDWEGAEKVDREARYLVKEIMDG